MIKKTRFTMICIVVLSLIANSTSFGRSLPNTESKGRHSNLSSASDDPAHQIVGHRVGLIELGLSNNGTFGNGFAESTQDVFTGQPVPSCEYPKASNIEYLFAGAFWIGAVVGRDTLVSTSADGWNGGYEEFIPDTDDRLKDGNIKKRSLLFPDIDSLYRDAVSEEDYIMVYRDTGTIGVNLDFVSNRQHTPLNIKVTQKSYAWSYEYADDFILFDFEIQNMGVQDLHEVYMGIYVDADIGASSLDGSARASDDLSGFVETDTIDFGLCSFEDTINIAWTADNDGDPDPGTKQFTNDSPTAVTGTRIIRTPATKLDVSYNWWISGATASTDFGPRELEGKGRWKEEFRDFESGFLGTPEGDANKYYTLKNQEFDYDQARINQYDPSLWTKPSETESDGWVDGLDTRYLLSFGPFEIKPGERLPLSFAYVAGNNFHQSPTNIDNLPDNPNAYYDSDNGGINFDSLTLNASWAANVYDNPGRDSDGSGKYLQFLRKCCEDTSYVDMEFVDTISVDPLVLDTVTRETEVLENCQEYFYRGDGIPDFQGASPPPAPKFWITPDIGTVHVRFNGYISETSKDVFSNEFDFEGYRVYYSRDERESSYSLHSSYDVEDYNRYAWNSNIDDYILNEAPFSTDELSVLYDDPISGFIFNPMNYPRSNPYTASNGRVYFFEAQDFNVSELGVSTPIFKSFPNQEFPSHPDIDSIMDTTEFTDDGYLKYYEYHTTIENLLPTVPYYFNVTAFDYGSPASGLPALESSKSFNAQLGFANSRGDQNLAESKEIYIYPNPYRIDGNYQELGYEKGENGNEAKDRIRAIHFANLPPKCLIKIFSLDGDLIREIVHDTDPFDPSSGNEKWNLITRNTQMTVSGLYYWTVEIEGQETQIGKLVIIM